MRAIAEGLRDARDRFGANIGWLAARARHGLRRHRPWAGTLGRTEMLIALAIAAALVVAFGLAFDALSVARARALPPAIHWLFGIVSNMGKSQWELIPAGVVVLVLLFGRWDIVPPSVRAAWFEVGVFAGYIFGSIGGAGLIVNIVKQPIGRGRPPSFDTYGAFVLHPFQWSYAFQSFPSGHATTAGALAAIGFLLLRPIRIPLLVFGLAIGVSRVVIGAHYPSDVLAGLLLGYFFSLWLAGRFAAFGWAFARQPTGAIRARAAGLAHGFRTPARAAVVLAGLVDALLGRAVFVPALYSIGKASHGESRVRRDRPDEA
jgi:membrane-associated phospholipid phosphatase